MAPIKFEENIKDKLENRRLQPSEEAWNNLESLLDTQEKKRYKGLLWIGLAASLIGVFFVVQQFRIKETMDNKNKTIVVEEKQIKEHEKANRPKATIQKEADSNIKKLESKIVETKIEVINREKQSRVLHSKNNLKHERKNNNAQRITSINNVEVKREEQKETSNKNSSDIVVFEDVQEEITSKNTVANSLETETDALLNAAKRNIKKEIYSKGESVDPNSLLQDVETEMEPSLRRQIFRTIEKNYQSVKTTLVTRND